MIFELAEEITNKFPGMRVQFIGDVQGDLPPEIEEVVRTLESRFMEGKCQECGKQIPDDLPENWSTLSDINDEEISGWLCPECDKG